MFGFKPILMIARYDGKNSAVQLKQTCVDAAIAYHQRIEQFFRQTSLHEQIWRWFVKSDSRPEALKERCNTRNAHKRHNDVKTLINASGKKEKLIPCCMHIIFMSFCSHWCLGKPEMHQSRRWSNSGMALRSSSISSPYSCCTA